MPASSSNMNSIATDDVVQMQTRLQSILRGRVDNFRIVCQESGLILQGQATNFHAKQLAQQEVMNMTMLPILANEITVA
jgi:hypothetical protein